MEPAIATRDREPGIAVSSPVALIIKDKSGGASSLESQVFSLVEGAGMTVSISQEADPKAAAEEAIAGGATVVIVGGGDGTVSSVASAVSGTSAVLGVLPTGTLNHFAKDLGIPVDLAEAVQTIANGKVRTIDTAEVNGRVFINNSSLGLYPRFAVFKESQRKLGKTRLFSLAWAMVMAVRRIPFLRLSFHSDSESLHRRTPLIFFGNNEYSLDGNGTRNCLDEGKLCVYIVNATNGRSLVWLSVKLLLRHWKTVTELEKLSITEAVVETKRSRVRVSCDGEVEWMQTPLTYRIRPASLRVLAP